MGYGLCWNNGPLAVESAADFEQPSSFKPLFHVPLWIKIHNGWKQQQQNNNNVHPEN